MIVDGGYAFLVGCNQPVGLLAVELQDALHLDFHELEQVVAGNVTNQRLGEGLKSLFDV